MRKFSGWSDYTVLVFPGKDGTFSSQVCAIPVDMLASGKSGKLVLNPIYRIIRHTKDGYHIRRRREYDTWELECLLMLKAMPHHLFLENEVMKDMKANCISGKVVKLLRRGVIVEVPNNFI